MIAANLPDIDVLVFATDTPSVSFRRGLDARRSGAGFAPIALTAVMVLAGRLRVTKPGGATDSSLDRRIGHNSNRDPNVESSPELGVRVRSAWVARARIYRCLLARRPRLPEQLWRAAAVAARLALVLRRRRLHRRSVAVGHARRRRVAVAPRVAAEARACGAPRRGGVRADHVGVGAGGPTLRARLVAADSWDSASVADGQDRCQSCRSPAR